MSWTLIAASAALSLAVVAPPVMLDQSESLEAWEAKTLEKQPPEKVMDAAGVQPGMVVGEVGAGLGRFTVHLARRVGPGGRILANDIDAGALSFLHDRCAKAGIDNVETILGKEADALFPEGTLDLVFMVATYHWFDQPVAMLESLTPALKPGATVFMVEPDPERGPGGSDHGVSTDRVRREAAEAGFELIRTETFLPEDLIFVLRARAH
jgi:ubiquinone/menaquinone biosynthesis C-methylase UbiE